MSSNAAMIRKKAEAQNNPPKSSDSLAGFERLSVPARTQAQLFRFEIREDFFSSAAL